MMSGSVTVPAPTQTVAGVTDGAVAPVDPEPQGPVPPRRWWLKRLTVLVALLAAALALVRLGWGWEADRRLRRMVEPLRAERWPLTVVDLAPPTVPEEENAAAYLKAAIAAIDRRNESPASSSLSYPDYPPFGSAWETLASRSVAGSAKTFPLARRARAFDRFDWGTRYTRPAIAVLLPHLNNARELANTLGDAALYAHEHGDDAAALETMRDLRHSGDGLEGEHFLVSHLVRIGIESLAQQRLQLIAAGLRVGPEADATGPTTLLPTTQPTMRPASKAQVRALIGELLDERGFADALKTAFAGERAVQLDTADWMGQTARVTRPMFTFDALRMLEQDEVLMEAADKPNWPAAQSFLAASAAGKPAPPVPAPGTIFGAPPPPGAKRQAMDYTRVLSSNLIGNGSMSRTIQQHTRVRADRRLTAVVLAAQLYHADHGDWPPTLQVLVPRYLPAVPQDPMAPDGRALGYVLVKGGLPGGGDRPLVFSVGDDGVDDSAKGGLPTTPWYGWHRGRDEWRDVTHWVPAPAATQRGVR
jgi:hypothetical protein